MTDPTPRPIRARIAESRLSPLAALVPRARIGAKHISKQARHVSRWLVSSREHTNFTYELTDNNMEHLKWFVSEITNQSYATTSTYVDEILSDTRLKSTYVQAIQESTRRGLADVNVRFGRRVAWYALIRAKKPKLVVETGTDKGLGSLVMASALIRNGAGRLITIDINPAAGYLIREKYREVTTIRVGDSISIINELDDAVDLFLHDSDHSATHERRELETISAHLSSRAIVVSDNAHVTDVLSEWAKTHDRRFLFFSEEPKNHWYPGAGLGVAW